MGNLASRATDAFSVRDGGELLALVDVDHVLHMHEPRRRVLVEVRDHCATTLHRGIDGRVVRTQTLLEERSEECAIDQVVEYGGVGQVPHEVHLTVEQR